MPSKLGRYEIIRELGKGAMGVVYEGRDPNINRRVAIKTARRDVMEASGMADEMMERFLREAQAAGTLNHPNIITIFDADEEGDMAYIAMEFLEGGDLQDLISGNMKMDVPKIVELGATISDALAVAHDQGVVHRDIKPANILMPDNAPIKVADFGIARVSNSSLTQEGALIGTPHYMSPEQFMGQKVDGRSDLFSLGIILYEMFTGEKPFSGEALSTVMHNVVKTNPVHPKEFNFAVTDAIDQVVMKILSKRPGERYADGRLMAAALRESLKENPDPVVLGFSPPPSADATVVSGGSAVEATVMSQTAPGAAPPPEALEATVTGGTAGEATQINPVATESGTGKKPVLLAAGAGLVVVVVAVLIFALSGGGGGSSDPANGIGTSSEIPEFYFTRFSAEIYEALDPMTAVNWSGDQEMDIDKLTGEITDVTVMLEIYDWKDKSVTLWQGEYNCKTDSAIPLEVKPEAIGFRVWKKGTSGDDPHDDGVALTATRADQMAKPKRPVIMLPSE
jgi:serine/threonine-protein kinase